MLSLQGGVADSLSTFIAESGSKPPVYFGFGSMTGGEENTISLMHEIVASVKSVNRRAIVQG